MLTKEAYHKVKGNHMAKKLLIAISFLFFSINLIANENELSSDTHPTDICDKQYSVCMTDCRDIENEVNKELCYDDCDKNYEICLDKIQSE